MKTDTRIQTGREGNLENRILRFALAKRSPSRLPMAAEEPRGPVKRPREPTILLRRQARAVQKGLVATLAMLLAAPLFAGEPAAALTTTPATNSTAVTAPATAPALPPAKVIPPEKVNLPPELAEVVRLTESGVDQSVVLSYIQKAPMSYGVSADQIIYLRDLGVSQTVLTALVEHGATTPAPETQTAAPAYAPVALTQPAVAEPAPAAAPPDVTGAAAPFYNSLSPYGSWLDVPGYGWCWQPAAAVTDPNWQPYANDGNWLWSNDGWYWNSYYSWGWAPFHYGRWCRYPDTGWIWCPDSVWGSSWVCWRDWGDYCGWAPLPPGACFTAGIGWTFGGLGVGIDCGFGLPWSCFNFVPYRHFGDRDWRDHRLGGAEARGIFDRSHPHNEFGIAGGHRFINRGVDPSRVEAATHTTLRPVAVRELPPGGNHLSAVGQLERSGHGLAVYRPGSTLAVPRNPALRSLNTPRTFAGTTGFWSSQRAENRPTAFPNAANSARPNYAPTFSRSLSAPTPNRGFSTPAPRSVPGGNFQSRPSSPAFRSTPAPSFQPNNSWRSSPAWSVARPSYSAPSYSFRSTPSWSPSRPAFSSPSFSSHSFGSRSFSAPAAPSFGGGFSRSFGSRSFGAPSAPSFGGGSSHSFGGNAPSFSGGSPRGFGRR